VSLQDNAVFSNTADYGGGVWLVGHSTLLVQPTVRGCQIYSNTAASYGGGIYAGYAQNIALEDNDLYQNQAGLGGGAYLSSATYSTLSSNRVHSNTADYGAGLYLNLSDGATLASNDIQDNRAAGLAGGLWIYSSVDVRLVNNLIAGNRLTGSGDGAGVHLFQNSTAEFLHTTLANNGGAGGHGLYVSDGSTAALTNTLVASNTVGVYVGTGCSAALEATLWGGGSWANGIDLDGAGEVDPGAIVLSGDPAFVDPTHGDYHIGPASAAREAGLATGVATDIDGQARLGVPDIGADEYVLTVHLPVVMRDY
jgi:parallel beta-helix repeat protein